VRVTGINAYDGQANALQFVPQPTGHRACFKADPLGERCALLNHPRERARIGRRLALEQYLPILIHDAHRRLFLRDAQSNMLLHCRTPVRCDTEVEPIGLCLL
jgi:hypothetical protein